MHRRGRGIREAGIFSKTDDHREADQTLPPLRATGTAITALTALAFVLLAVSALSSGPPTPRCTAFTPPSAVHSGKATVEWQFRLCAADQRRGAQLRFHNPGQSSLAFNFRLFTSDVHGCEAADDLSSVLTGSGQLGPRSTTPWPYPTVRLGDDEYRGRLWLCVFDAAPIREELMEAPKAPAS